MKDRVKQAIMLCICGAIILVAIVIELWPPEIISWSSQFDSMESSKVGWASYVPGTLQNALENADNVAFDELAVYDYETLALRISHDQITFASSIAPFLVYYQNDFPIQRMEAVDDSHVCVQYKVMDDNGELIYLYVLFERILEEQINENQENVSGETWRVSKEWYYVSEPMTYADFSSVQIGTGYEAFAAIDPTVKYDYLRQPYAPIFGFMSYRLLEDGLLVTEFEDIDPQFTDENVYIRQDAEHYRVKSMQFYPWGTEDVPDSYQILNAEAGAITFPTE